MTSTVSGNGELITWDIKIRNKGASPDTNVVVTGAFPAGVQYVNSNLEPGVTFDSSIPKLLIPIIQPGQTVVSKIVTKVTDITLAPFIWNLSVSGTNTDPNLVDNTITLTVNSGTCSPLAGAKGYTACGGCVDLSILDTPCSQCTTEWRLDNSSIDNLTIDNWDVSTGKGHFTINDFTKDGTIKYSIWCVGCSDGNDYEVSGPALITVPKLANNCCDDPSLLQTFDTMAAAVAALGLNKRFLWSELNLEGVSSPNGSLIGVTKN